MTKNEQAYYLNQQAGANQTQNLAAILSNFDTALEATEIALNSAGSAARENEKYMEGLEAKTNQLKATFQQLASSVVDSGLVKGVLDLANAFLQLLNTPIGTFVTQVTLLTGVLWGGTGLIKAMGVIPAFFSSASTAVTGLSAALGIAAPQLMLIAAGIAAIVAVTPLVVDGFKRLTDEAYNAEQELTVYNEQLSENQARLEELNKIPYKNRTDEIQAEIDKLQEENKELEKNIAQWERKRDNAKFEQEVMGTKEVEGSYVRTGSSDAAFGDYVYGSDMTAMFVQSSEEALNELVRVGLVTKETVEATLADVGGNTAKALEALGYSLESGVKEISSQAYYEDVLEKLRSEITKFQKTGEIDADVISSYENYRSVLEDLVETATEFEDSGGDITGWVENIVNAFQGLPDISEDIANGYYNVTDTLMQLSDGMTINQIQYDQLLSTFPQLADALNQTADGYEANIDALDGMLGAMSANATMTEELQQIYATLISGMGISESQINKLIAVYPALSSMIRQNASQYYLEIQALADSAAAGNQWATSMINAQNSTTGVVASQVSQRIDKYKKELQALLTSGEVGAGAMAGAIAGLIGAISVLESLKNQASGSSFSGFSPSGGVSVGGGSSGGTEEDPIAKQTEQFKEQIEILEHKLFLMEKEGATEEERITQLRKIQAELDKQKQWYYSQGLDANSEYIRDLEEQWWDYEDQIKDIYKEQAEIYELLFSTVASKAQDEIDTLKEKKQAIQDQNDALEEQIRLEEALDNLARAKQNKVMVYKDGQLQYVTDVDAVSEAQKEVDDINREQALEDELEAIDKEIEKWEEFKDAWESVVNDYQKQQDLLLLEQKLGIKLEGENWEERLGNLQEYIDKYNDLMSKANAIGKIPTNAMGTLSFQPDNRYASGTSGARSGVSLVGENGPELRVLNRGDGILPADITKNLWAWGSMTPASLMSTLMGGAQAIGQQIGIVIENFNPNLPNVTDGEGFAKYMRNNFWREALQMAKA